MIVDSRTSGLNALARSPTAFSGGTACAAGSGLAARFFDPAFPAFSLAISPFLLKSASSEPRETAATIDPR